jgi:hypothetical protein
LGESYYGLIDRPNRPENLEVEPEEEVEAEEKALIFCKVEKAIKKMRDKMATGMMMHQRMYCNCSEKVVSEL